MLSADEKKKLEAEVNGYLTKIKAGSMTLQQAASAHKNVSVQAATSNLTANAEGYPDDMVKMIQGMKPGEAKAGEISDAYFYLLTVKNDIMKKTAERTKTEDGRKSLLSDYKGKEFSDQIAKEADSVSGVTLNEKALDSYDPSMFADKSANSSGK